MLFSYAICFKLFSQSQVSCVFLVFLVQRFLFQYYHFVQGRQFFLIEIYIVLQSASCKCIMQSDFFEHNETVKICNCRSVSKWSNELEWDWIVSQMRHQDQELVIIEIFNCFFGNLNFAHHSKRGVNPMQHHMNKLNKKCKLIRNIT